MAQAIYTAAKGLYQQGDKLNSLSAGAKFSISGAPLAHAANAVTITPLKTTISFPYGQDLASNADDGGGADTGVNWHESYFVLTDNEATPETYCFVFQVGGGTTVNTGDVGGVDLDSTYDNVITINLDDGGVDGAGNGSAQALEEDSIIALLVAKINAQSNTAASTAPFFAVAGTSELIIYDTLCQKHGSTVDLTYMGSALEATKVGVPANGLEGKSDLPFVSLSFAYDIAALNTKTFRVSVANGSTVGQKKTIVATGIANGALLTLEFGSNVLNVLADPNSDGTAQEDSLGVHTADAFATLIWSGTQWVALGMSEGAANTSKAWTIA